MDVSFIKFIELFKNLQDCRCQTQTNKIEIEVTHNINFKVKSYFRLVCVCVLRDKKGVLYQASFLFENVIHVIMVH